MIINDLNYMEDAFYGISGGDYVSISLNASASDSSAGIGGSTYASGGGSSSSSLYGYAYTNPFRSRGYVSGHASTPGASAYGSVSATVW